MILVGALDPIVHALPLDDISAYVLPEDVASPIMGNRIALAFVFLQSLHYAVWLRLVPEAMRKRPGMRSFAGGVRALEADFTRVGVIVLTAIATGFIVAGAVDAPWSREIYLSLASFHAYLELAFLGRWLAR
jgi:hypothetical protein